MIFVFLRKLLIKMCAVQEHKWLISSDMDGLIIAVSKRDIAKIILICMLQTVKWLLVLWMPDTCTIIFTSSFPLNLALSSSIYVYGFLIHSRRFQDLLFFYHTTPGGLGCSSQEEWTVRCSSCSTNYYFNKLWPWLIVLPKCLWPFF